MMVAVRNYGLGRVALLNRWRQYTVGSGDQWIFDSQVLSRGFAGRESHFGLAPP